VSKSLNKSAHERLRKLQELDAATKIPFILIELTGEGDGKGEIEICGKDEYGVYQALDQYLLEEWGCSQLDAGDMSEDTKIPFCNAAYLWPGYRVDDELGMNSMGRCTMQLIDFVAGKLSWTLAVVNSGNVGKGGEIREQQLVFKAPHPMNLVAPHLMIGLRSTGHIDVYADLADDLDVLEDLDAYFAGRFSGQRLAGYEGLCDRHYQAGLGIFKGTSGSADSNFGLLVTLVCDKVVTIPGWSLVACSSGSVGENSEQCEQQLVFRKDEHPLGDSSYMMVVLNASGNIEVNGKEFRGVQGKLDKFLKKRWGCQESDHFSEGETNCTRYTWSDAQDLLAANGEIISFFEMVGFEMQVCTQYTITEGEVQTREQQLLFRPGTTEVGTIEPHLLVELYTGEGSEEIHADLEEPTQVLANQYIRFVEVAPKSGCEAMDKAKECLDDFVINYLGGAKESENKYNVNLFMCRGWYENNLAQWTMRVCDFLVDRLGWSFIVCSLCNEGEYGQLRKQQLLFRYEGDRRDVPVSSVNLQDLNPSQWSTMSFPDHWTIPRVLRRDAIHDVVPCSKPEVSALQSMCDSTFRRVLTRDRVPDDDAPDDEEMPYRLEVVAAFRSEHAWLHHRYLQTSADGGASPTRGAHGGKGKGKGYGKDGVFQVKTSTPATCLTARLERGHAYLFHGTNPSSAMSILKTGFALAHAGSATGTMYGEGVYMAETSSKSDEYGRDDGGNTYPGLNAILVARCFIGNPFIVNQAGDHVTTAKETGFHCVCGDRESTVGTYREFVFFNEGQIYPEFTIIYRRQWVSAKVPNEMRVSATGTTGRFWQMRGDVFGFRGWKNVPTEVNKILIKIAFKGNSVANISVRGKEYSWDVDAKTVTNSEGVSSPLRPPMQK